MGIIVDATAEKLTLVDNKGRVIDGDLFTALISIVAVKTGDSTHIIVPITASSVMDELADKYVPAMGMAETCGGEILRAFARLYYRYYNDGDMPYEGYGNETCNSSYRYLTNYSFFRDRLKVCDDCDEWYRRLQAIMPDLYEWLIKRSDLFEVTNNVDSRTPTEADLDAARESEWDEEDDYYDDYDEE